MTRQEKIEILMEDRCTKSEAEKHLKNGTTIFEDLEENLQKYISEWDYLNDPNDDITFTEKVKKMVESKKPMDDWGIVEKDGKTYYIMYVL